jgi:gas vesicle protein
MERSTLNHELFLKELEDMSKHRDENNHNSRGFLSGLFYGALIGTAAGLLMAPRSGIETRQQLRETGVRLRDQVEQTATEARHKAEELQQQSREYLEETKERLERTADAVVKSAQETWNERETQPEFPEHLVTAEKQELL